MKIKGTPKDVGKSLEENRFAQIHLAAVSIKDARPNWSGDPCFVQE